MASVLMVSGPLYALTGQRLAPGLFQLTGTELRPGQTSFPLPEISDPAPPFLTPSGQVEIYGSAPYFIQYPSWREFESGGTYRAIPLDIRLANGNRLLGIDVQPWDIRKYVIMGQGHKAEEVLVGGAMTPTQGRPVPVFPEDNWTRRIYLFRRKPSGWWQMDKKPLTDEVQQGWVGHSYGGNIFQEGNDSSQFIFPYMSGRIFLFYEKVAVEQDGSPWVTELFARQIPSGNGSMREIPILSVGNPPYPATRRTIGGYLMEGPRPIKMNIEGQDFYIIGFSCGDYPTDSYTISYAWSRNLLGPYHPMMSPNGTDLLDLGMVFKKRFGLSWVGRPSFYSAGPGRYEMLFHGVTKAILPDNDYSQWPSGKYTLDNFFRSIFKVRLQVTLSADGVPLLIPLIH